jgi:hypothetical protein
MRKEQRKELIMKLQVPSHFDEAAFHQFALHLAGQAVGEAKDATKDRVDPIYLVPENLALLLKERVLEHLPQQYVEVTAYKGYHRFRASGRHRFLRPIPRDVMLDAVRKTGLISIEESAA